jgi:DNA-binding CsgD family transcriptional regulator
VHALFHLALIDAFQGLEEPCRAHASRGAELAASLGIAHPTSERVQLALLELGLGRVERAIEELERVPPKQPRARPADLPGAQLLVEAYARAGRLGEAREALERFERALARRPRPAGLALAARCRGIVAPEEEFERHFADALRHHSPHESLRRARTELCLGERRRRAGRRVQARRSLRAALATFERVGARPWADRARRELEAAGDGPAERVGELTPRELQVARAVASGARNREVGAALYLSPKTVEYHLGKVFRKLGVRSRTELAHLLATELRG